jgi:hypothetical protein
MMEDNESKSKKNLLSKDEVQSVMGKGGSPFELAAITEIAYKVSKLNMTVTEADQKFRDENTPNVLSLMTMGSLLTSTSSNRISVVNNGNKTLNTSTGKGVNNPIVKGAGKIDLTIKPSAENQKLQNAIDQLYRPNATVGNGSTMDAIRHELKTGELVGGKGHMQKGQERVKNLENILNKETLNPQDKALAETLLQDLNNAISGK